MTRSNNMINYTETRKNDTATKVEEAIELMKAQGRRVTRKELIELAEVSSSVLCKDHIKEILKKHQVLMFEPKVVEEKPGGDSYATMKKNLAAAEKKLEKKKQQLKDRDIMIEAKEKIIDELRNEKAELERDNAVLRGKYQKVLEYLYRNGMDDKEIKHLFQY